MGGQTFGQSYANITTAATTVVKAAPGTLVRINVNTPAAGTITCYDNASAGSGTKIATITLTTGQATVLTFECDFKNGLTIVTSATPDITVVYF